MKFVVLNFYLRCLPKKLFPQNVTIAFYQTYFLSKVMNMSLMVKICETVPFPSDFTGCDCSPMK